MPMLPVDKESKAKLLKMADRIAKKRSDADSIFRCLKKAYFMGRAEVVEALSETLKRDCV